MSRQLVTTEALERVDDVLRAEQVGESKFELILRDTPSVCDGLGVFVEEHLIKPSQVDVVETFAGCVLAELTVIKEDG